MIIVIVILIALALIFGLSRILEADALDTVLTVAILLLSFATVMIAFYIGLMIWKELS